ncbi:TolC family protein [Aestuariicella hydrocarbonica]|uniref:TolC family protein n=1 Tax=Pseudomaricurvus hydrocarbonicus TaxID=1470433 RepID=A0A9E5MP65_9GAMM|nr:TolC family protein [Aestuariicella hydrocarbonica]NHO67840.1 TolC family protein [Aestuariicella hydrocarbonica]
MKYLRRLTPVIVLGSLLLGGCSSLGGETGYAAQAEQQRQIQQWSQLDNSQAVMELTDLLHSPELEFLIDEALQANPSLQQTLLSLNILQAQYRQSRSEQLPSVNAGVDASKSEDQEALYTGSASISWELDLWLKVANQTSAAAKDVAEQQALYQSARDTLVAEVMKGWLQLTNLQHTVRIEEQRVEVLTKNEQLIVQRYRSGLGSLEDLDSARSTAASARANLESTRESLAQQQRALNVLLGRSQGAAVIASDYPDVLVPLADLPQQTLQRRPDLKAAWLAIEADDFRTQVAYKNMLPSISLQASLEDSVGSLSQALLKDPVWALLSQLTAPLFQGGALKAAAEAAELTTAQSYQAYRETLFSAVQEVEDAIGLERSLNRQLHYTQAAVDSARRNLNQYQSKYRSGLATMLDLLLVQQQAYDLEAQLDNLTYQFLSNRITLGLALGLGVNT